MIFADHWFLCGSFVTLLAEVQHAFGHTVGSETMKGIAIAVLSLLFVCSGPVFADQDHDKGHDKDHDKTFTDRDHDRDHDRDKGDKGGSGVTGGTVGSGGTGGSATGGAGGSATANGGNATANGGTVNSSNANTANGGSVNNSGNSSNKNRNSQSQSQNQTANGGNVSGSGNSTVKNTSTNNNTVTGGQGGAGGNATATNTVTGGTGGSATGGAGGSATGGTQSQSASVSGNDSSYNSTTNVEAPKIPVSTAYSPTAIPTVPCFKGFGAGVQTAPVGASFGGGKVDENCAILETARSFALSGSRMAYCKTMLINKYAKKAGVTLADCMRDVTPTAAPAPATSLPTPLPVAPQIVVATPAPAPARAPVVAVPISNFPPQLVGICTFASNFECNLQSKAAGDPTHVTTICDEMITQATKLLKANPGTVVKLIGNENSRERNATNMYALARAKNVQRKFIAAGIPESSTVVVTGGSGDRTVEVWVVPASDSAYARRSN